MASLYVVTVFDPVEMSEPVTLLEAEDIVAGTVPADARVQASEDQDGTIEWLKYWQGDVMVAQVHRVEIPDEG